jgi:AP-1 complex subunit gamma-1
VCARIAAVANIHAPSPLWHIHTLLGLLAIAGNASKREVLSRTLYLIAHAHPSGELPGLAHTLYCHALGALETSERGGNGSDAQQPLLQAAVWVVGEYGDALLAAPPAASDAATDGAAAPTAALPPAHARTEADVVRTLTRVAKLYYTSPETRAMVLTAALKLTARFGRDPGAVAAARALLADYAGSSDTELQTRAVEYGVIATPGAVPGLDEPGRR